MNVATQMAAAYALDLACGDPRWLPHPVKWIGRGAQALERPLRRAISNQRLAGVLAAFFVVGGVALLAWAALRLAYGLHPWAGDALSVLLLYTTLATRDLAAHAMRVYRALKRKDLARAREFVSHIVGRDTQALDEAGVARAAVESVAENTVDGVTAPLFFAALGGPVCALAYKAVSTLDSTFGYKNERYIDFGWASARLDDAAAYLPARLSFPLIAVAALLCGERPRAAWRLGVRDGRKHASPNAGIADAAAAGALGVQLGGALCRNGQRVELPLLGEPREPLQTAHIRRAVVLMAMTSLLAAALFAGARLAVEGWR
jgi:adenosylcobinamide-phosphate synthase